MSLVHKYRYICIWDHPWEFCDTFGSK